MEYPKISIVTASFNQAKYLEHTINSIISQNYPNLEYIIIDGGSTDGSVEIIKKYEKYIYYWVSEKDNGVCDAINRGLKLSTGDIMGCINSDDMLHKNSLFTIAEIFSQLSQVEWLVGANTAYDESGRTVFVMQTPPTNIYHYFNGSRDFLQLESTFWKRCLWDRAGAYFNPSHKFASDFDLWIRFFHHGKVYRVNALIGGFRYRKSNQLSIQNRDLYLKEVDSILVTNKSIAHEENIALLNLYKKIDCVKNPLVKKILKKIYSKHLRSAQDLLRDDNVVNFNYKEQFFFI